MFSQGPKNKKTGGNKKGTKKGSANDVEVEQTDKKEDGDEPSSAEAKTDNSDGDKPKDEGTYTVYCSLVSTN